MAKSLSVFEQHQLAIARRTLRMADPILGVMGGMTKEQAREVVTRLTGKVSPQVSAPKERPSLRSLVAYDVHSLDVWGNRKDGYQVNDVLPSAGTVFIPENATDKEVVAALKEGGFIKKNLRASSVDVEGEPLGPESRVDTFYVNHKPTSRPEYELRRHVLAPAMPPGTTGG